MRLQLALNVRDLDEAIAFYGKMFDAVPHKLRPGYANFAIEEPPLKLVLFENPGAAERLNHLGVEVFDDREIQAQSERLSAAGLLDEVQQDTTCCHATQDKLWSHEPQGLKWEWYRITDDQPDAATSRPETTGRVCCAGLVEEQAGVA